MPTFDTPEPISVTLEVGVGDIRIVASDRTDTIVDVRPSDPAKKSDVTAAELTRVEFADGRLIVEPEEFYVFASKERIRVPHHLAAEMVAYDVGIGELRTNYAGFFDAGFGWRHRDLGGEFPDPYSTW